MKKAIFALILAAAARGHCSAAAAPDYTELKATVSAKWSECRGIEDAGGETRGKGDGATSAADVRQAAGALEQAAADLDRCSKFLGDLNAKYQGSALDGNTQRTLDSGGRFTWVANNFRADAERLRKKAGPKVELDSIDLGMQELTGDNGGKPLKATVKLKDKASADVKVALESDNPAAKVDKDAVVPAGQDHANFNIAVGKVAQAQKVRISATLDDASKTAKLTLRPAPAAPVAKLDSIDLSASELIGDNGGRPVQAAVKLKDKAAADVVVALESDNAAARVDKSVTIRAGQDHADFKVQTAPVAAAVKAKLTASLDGVAKSATIAINPAPAAAKPAPIADKPAENKTVIDRVDFDRDEAVAGKTLKGTVVLNRAYRGELEYSGLAVTLVSDNENAKVPTTVIIIPGQQTVGFDITTSAGLGSPRRITISAELAYGRGSRKTSSFLLKPPPAAAKPAPMADKPATAPAATPPKQIEHAPAIPLPSNDQAAKAEADLLAKAGARLQECRRERDVVEQATSEDEKSPDAGVLKKAADDLEKAAGDMAVCHKDLLDFNSKLKGAGLGSEWQKMLTDDSGRRIATLEAAWRKQAGFLRQKAAPLAAASASEGARTPHPVAPNLREQAPASPEAAAPGADLKECRSKQAAGEQTWAQAGGSRDAVALGRAADALEKLAADMERCAATNSKEFGSKATDWRLAVDTLRMKIRGLAAVEAKPAAVNNEPAPVAAKPASEAQDMLAKAGARLQACRRERDVVEQASSEDGNSPDAAVLEKAAEDLEKAAVDMAACHKDLLDFNSQLKATALASDWQKSLKDDSGHRIATLEAAWRKQASLLRQKAEALAAAPAPAPAPAVAQPVAASDKPAATAASRVVQTAADSASAVQAPASNHTPASPAALSGPLGDVAAQGAAPADATPTAPLKLASATYDPGELPQFALVSLDLQEVVGDNGGAPVNGTVHLTKRVREDTWVYLDYDSREAYPNSPVKVLAGQDQAVFNVRTVSVAAAKQATITAKLLGGSIRKVGLAIKPAPDKLDSLKLAVSEVVGDNGGKAVKATVKLSGKQVYAQDVILQSDDQYPDARFEQAGAGIGSVIIDAGGDHADFDILTSNVDAPVKVKITATLENVVRTAYLTINPLPASKPGPTAGKTPPGKATDTSGFSLLGGASTSDDAGTDNNPPPSTKKLSAMLRSMTFNNSGGFTVPPGVTKIWVEMVGGGGGGGGGGAGGAGAYFRHSPSDCHGTGEPTVSQVSPSPSPLVDHPAPSPTKPTREQTITMAIEDVPAQAAELKVRKTNDARDLKVRKTNDSNNEPPKDNQPKEDKQPTQADKKLLIGRVEETNVILKEQKPSYDPSLDKVQADLKNQLENIQHGKAQIVGSRDGGGYSPQGGNGPSATPTGGSPGGSPSSGDPGGGGYSGGGGGGQVKWIGSTPVKAAGGGTTASDGSSGGGGSPHARTQLTPAQRKINQVNGILSLYNFDPKDAHRLDTGQLMKELMAPPILLHHDEAMKIVAAKMLTYPKTFSEEAVANFIATDKHASPDFGTQLFDETKAGLKRADAELGKIRKDPAQYVGLKPKDDEEQNKKTNYDHTNDPMANYKEAKDAAGFVQTKDATAARYLTGQLQLKSAEVISTVVGLESDLAAEGLNATIKKIILDQSKEIPVKAAERLKEGGESGH